MATASTMRPSPYSGFIMPAVDAAYIAAWLVPALVGAGIWIALGGTRRRHDIPIAIGAGWLAGVFLAAGFARLTATADTAHAFAHAWPWCVAVGAAAWIVAIVRWRRVDAGVSRTLDAFEPAPMLRVLWWLLLIWTLVRFLSIGDEASLRPVFPWDAWSAWSIKPKTWFLTGYFEPYVSMQEWLTKTHFPLRTAASWSYPELLAWMQLWFAGAAGAWNEPLVDVAWCGALAAFALAAYGYWRTLGLAPSIAIALVYALVSLPLIDTHVALAGYADLWLALVLGLVVLAWTRWLIGRERGQLVFALALALCLPLIKVEGMVWLVAFAGIAILDFLPRGRRWLAVVCLAALAVIGLLILGSGSIDVGWSWIAIPSIGTFELAWHGVGVAMLRSLFSLPNWHLLWYIVPVFLVLRRRRFREDRAAQLVGIMLLIDFGFLFVLFFLTTASAWAQDFTSANRLILQLVPSLFVLAGVLLRPLDPTSDAATAPSPLLRNKARASVAPSVPA